MRKIAYMRTVLFCSILSLSMLISGCVNSTRYVSDTQPDFSELKEGSAKITFERTKGFVGGGNAILVMLLSPSTTNDKHVICYLKKGISLEVSNYEQVLLGAQAGRLIFVSSLYQERNEFPITIPSERHDDRMNETREQYERLEMATAPYGPTKKQATIALAETSARIIVDKASRKNVVADKKQFENGYCDKVIYGTAIGYLRPGGSLTWQSGPIDATILAIMDYASFYGNSSYDLRMKNSAPLKIESGKEYKVTLTPNFKYNKMYMTVEEYKK